MPGVPFSCKAKKAQLQAKRARKAEKKARELEKLEEEEASIESPPAATAQAETHEEGRTTKGGKIYKNDKRSVFRKEAKAEVEQRIREARQDFTLRMFEKGVQYKRWWTMVEDNDEDEAGGPEIPRPTTFPKRPAWADTAQGKVEIDPREKAYFSAYTARLEETCTSLNYYERNLEVWRQLWRVGELSDVVAVVADARHPLFHVPTSLLRWVRDDLRKPVFVVLNKIDLVPREVLDRWIRYFKEVYPDIPFLTFTCHPNRETVTLDINAAQFRKRRMRQAKMKLVDYHQAQDQAGWERSPSPSPSPSPCPGSAKSSDELLAENNKYVKRRRRKRAASSPRFARLGSISEGSLVSDDLRSLGFNTDAEGDLSSEMPTTTPPGTPRTAQQETFKGESKAIREELCSSQPHTERAEVVRKVTELLAQAKALAREKGKRGAITLGMVGHPNVGKSSLVNVLKGEKVVSTSATAGHTKHLQHIPVDDELTLLDCPGLTFPVVGLPLCVQIIMGSFSLAQNREPYSAVHYLGQRLPLERIYHLSKPRCSEEGVGWSGWTLCEAYAEKNGFFVHRGKGIPDTYRAGQAILREVVNGVLVIYFLPPPSHVRQDDPIDIRVTEDEIDQALLQMEEEDETVEEENSSVEEGDNETDDTDISKEGKGRRGRRGGRRNRGGKKRNFREGTAGGVSSTTKTSAEAAEGDGVAGSLDIFAALQSGGASRSHRKELKENERCSRQRKGRKKEGR